MRRSGFVGFVAVVFLTITVEKLRPKANLFDFNHGVESRSRNQAPQLLRQCSTPPATHGLYLNTHLHLLTIHHMFCMYNDEDLNLELYYLCGNLPQLEA